MLSDSWYARSIEVHDGILGTWRSIEDHLEPAPHYRGVTRGWTRIPINARHAERALERLAGPVEDVRLEVELCRAGPEVQARQFVEFCSTEGNE